MKKYIKILFFASLIASISSCEILENVKNSQYKKADKSLTQLDYLERAPKFDIRSFLNDKVEGFAIIQDQKGKIIDSFTLKIDGEWAENRGTVKNIYTFNNGKKDVRTWLVTLDDSRNYTIIGHDFVKSGVGIQEQNVSRIEYTLNYLFQDKKMQVDFEDNVYLVDENSAIVISNMKNGKNNIGKIILSLKKIVK